MQNLIRDSFPQIPAEWRSALANAVDDANPLQLGETRSTKMRTLYTMVLLGDSSYGQLYLSTTLINGMLKDCKALDKVVKDAGEKLGETGM